MTPADRGLPKTCRLVRPGDFARVYAVRRSAAAGPLVVYAAAQEPPSITRIGLSVSRRIGNAVVRNRWKRRLREAFRRVRAALPAGYDFIVVVRSGLPEPGAAGLDRTAAALETLAARAAGRPAGEPSRSRRRPGS